MKTLKLKKDVVSRLDREQSAMVKGGADTTVIQQTKVCALTKQCETARKKFQDTHYQYHTVEAWFLKDSQ